jgi:hypothetical protein
MVNSAAQKKLFWLCAQVQAFKANEPKVNKNSIKDIFALFAQKKSLQA